MTAPSYTISDEAYLKSVLHSAKYVTAVSGILLGRRESPSNECATVRIVDCLPLSHSATTTFSTPIAEIALLLARKLATKRQLDLVGVYFGNEVATDRSIGVVPTRLGDHVRKTFGDATVLLMIEAPKLAPEVRRTEHAFRVCIRKETWGKGTLPDDALAVSDYLLEACDRLLSTECAGAPYSICDFEDHCGDPANNWLNPHVKSVTRGAPTNEADAEESGSE